MALHSRERIWTYGVWLKICLSPPLIDEGTLFYQPNIDEFA